MIPNSSIRLQVLTSDQSLILNEKPYFNKFGYEGTSGSPRSEAQSTAYSESTFLVSLKTMVRSNFEFDWWVLNTQYFEDFHM